MPMHDKIRTLKDALVFNTRTFTWLFVVCIFLHRNITKDSFNKEGKNTKAFKHELWTIFSAASSSSSFIFWK